MREKMQLKSNTLLVLLSQSFSMILIMILLSQSFDYDTMFVLLSQSSSMILIHGLLISQSMLSLSYSFHLDRIKHQLAQSQQEVKVRLHHRNTGVLHCLINLW